MSIRLLSVPLPLLSAVHAAAFGFVLGLVRAASDFGEVIHVSALGFFVGNRRAFILDDYDYFISHTISLFGGFMFWTFKVLRLKVDALYCKYPIIHTYILSIERKDTAP